MLTFKIKVVDKVFEITAFNETTKKYCGNFLTDEEANYVITLTEEDLINERNTSSTGKVYVNEEISALYRKIAEILVEENIVVFHSSSFMVNGKGFLITARSGVGKSTHSRNLKEYIGDRFIYINDDKPLLKVNENSVTVYGTPWNGKERKSNDVSASLRAILFLSRGETNTYRRIVNKEEIYIKMISQIYLPKEKANRELALKAADSILKNINFYEINVTKDIESAKMTYEEIIKNEIK